MMETKIHNQHTSKLAYIYLRQSTIAQVRFNQESTQRQYALQHKAQALGWPEHAIKILDSDLGMSGSQSEHREDFKMLVADVSMAKVGAVFALEASRLSRSCTDWHRLLELCALTGTLIIDEDGCYNPADFNDQLLLGLKGTMSQAELHFIRARLLGGKKNKAKKGELKFPLPVGFCYDDQNQIIFDHDEQVRHSVSLLFTVFKEMKSACGVLRYFRKEKLQFPKRANGGVWNGKMIWGTLTQSRVLDVLKNPSYAGVYAYGRYRCQKKLSSTGQIKTSMVCLPIDSWEIVIKEHHEAYITWEEYMTHQEILNNNRTNREENLLPTAAREGLALLQGLLLCSYCGRRLIVRYKKKGGLYQCCWKKRDGLEDKSCLSVRADRLDQAVVKRVLEIIKPAQIDIAIKAFEEVEKRKQNLDRQWQMKIERADYEAQLAQRRYEEVDPSNRLVAATLEKRWNDSLNGLEEVRAQYSEYQKKNNIVATNCEQKNKIQMLAKDLPRLWKSPSTSSKDRKQILRLFIKDIMLEKIAGVPSKAILHIRWQGGAVENLDVELPKKMAERNQHLAALIEQIRQFAKTMTDQQITDKMNREGIKTKKGNYFTVSSVKGLRHRYKIPSPQLNGPEEYSVKQLMEKFNISCYTVYYWIERGVISARIIGKKLWVFVDKEKEIELEKRIESSTKINIARLKSQTQFERGAV